MFSENLTPEFCLGSGSMSATKIGRDLVQFLPGSGSSFRSLLNFCSSNSALYIRPLLYLLVFCFRVSCSCFMAVMPSWISLSHLRYLLLNPFEIALNLCFFRCKFFQLGSLWERREGMSPSSFRISPLCTWSGLTKHVFLASHIRGPSTGPSLPWVSGDMANVIRLLCCGLSFMLVFSCHF